MKYDEPSYIKNVKLEILGQIASENNIQEIMSELSEYVTDVNAEIAKKSIRCFGRIIIRLQNIAKQVASQLRNFLSLKIIYVVDETMIVLKDILRKYPQLVSEFEPFFIVEFVNAITERQSKAAFVWILGQFGDQIQDAPYILERIIEDENDVNAIDL